MDVFFLGGGANFQDEEVPWETGHPWDGGQPWSFPWSNIPNSSSSDQ